MPLSTHHLALAHSAITHQIIGAFYDVYNALGYGFLESVYASAMPIALRRRGLSCTSETEFTVLYQGEAVGRFRADLIVEGVVVVELKSVRAFEASHDSQVLNYLRASKLTVGLLFNFGAKPAFKRFIWTGDQLVRG